ncbi:MAG: sigma-54-dependent Fis family transcriptional regulator [Candidatus Schekmanbacteria bacterium]|nr:sigma-54-dependent Fis family transcriptional regulator [Candidatus Schekmanbacteria bacterium]
MSETHGFEVPPEPLTGSAQQTVLVVDDDPSIVEFVSICLEETPHRILTSTSSRAALELCRLERPALVVLDYMMPELNGLDLLRGFKAIDDFIEGLVITGRGNERVAVELMKAGAFDYLPKPFQLSDLLNRVNAALAHRARRLAERLPYEELVLGTSRAMGEVMRIVDRAAPHRMTILVHGETGTGKELIARLIHRKSPRAELPFYAINCAAIPTTLMESELFGHTKGAFTGAGDSKIGLFEQAHGSSLFLDEIGEIDMTVQAKLLRAIQFGEIKPVGASNSKTVDVRLIAATNRNLADAVVEGRFREDLYYRLNVIALRMPPLRERMEDVGLLAVNFINKYRYRLKKDLSGLSREALAWLEGYSWPGNVRELENMIERAAVLCQHRVIGLEDLDSGQQLADATAGHETLGAELQRVGFYEVKRRVVADIESRLLREALRLSSGNVYDAAGLAQIPASYFYRLLKKYAIDFSSSAE